MRRLGLPLLLLGLAGPFGFHGGATAEARARRIQGENNLEPAAASRGTGLYGMLASVARLEHATSGYGFCTAVRVGARLFLTNQHCVRRCETMRFRLGDEGPGAPLAPAVFACRALLASSESLDYALYRVDPVDESGDPEAFPPAPLARALPADGLAAVVASHPVGYLDDEERRYKEMDRSDECVIGSGGVWESSSGRRTIAHYCDTEAGSSGAPLFDRVTGDVVALHWGGWEQLFNMAIPMALIVQDLEARLPLSVREELVIR